MKASIIAAALLLSLACSTESRAQVYTPTETITYEDNLSSWVIGQPKTVTNVETGLVVSQTDYDPTTALPIRTYAFGALQASATYRSDGLMQTVTDANNNTTTYADYYRGIPRVVTFADQRTQTAGINAIGQIEWFTDETGAKTCYA